MKGAGERGLRRDRRVAQARKAGEEQVDLDLGALGRGQVAEALTHDR